MPFDIGSIGEAAANTVSQGMLGQAMGLALEHHNDQRQLRQQNALQQLQIQGQEQLTDYNYNKQMELWHATNYGAQMAELQKAGLNPGLLYAKGGPGGQTGIQQGSVSGGQAQQNPGESQALIGMGLQFQNMAAQRDVLKAQKENIEADTQNKLHTTPNIDTDTQLKQSQIAQITQGIQNQKAIELLTKSQTIMQDLQNKIVGNTEREREDYIVAQTQLAQEQVMQAEQQTFIDRATAHAKADIIIQTAIGTLLQNALTKAETTKTQAQTQVDYATINKMAQDIAQGWTDLGIKDRQQKLNDWMNHAEIKLGNKAIWVGGVSRVLSSTMGMAGQLIK